MMSAQNDTFEGMEDTEDLLDEFDDSPITPPLVWEGGPPAYHIPILVILLEVYIISIAEYDGNFVKELAHVLYGIWRYFYGI